MLPGLHLALLIALYLVATPPTAVELVHVAGQGTVALAPESGYRCVDGVRSTLVERICHAADGRLLVRLRDGYRQHCGVDAATVDAMLRAESIGAYYRRELAGRYRCGPSPAD